VFLMYVVHVLTVFLILCVVYCSECVCVILCIVVPLPPGRNPLAVSSNSSKVLYNIPLLSLRQLTLESLMVPPSDVSFFLPAR
jgi:hypothetical protein